MKPILFNTEMVKAILDGRKTQTRRVCKGQPQDDGKCSPEDIGYKPPYKPGDILWVRETWAWLSAPDCGSFCLGPCKHYKGEYGCFVHKASNPNFTDKWNPSIHMPREAARLFLQVKKVRIERLNDIRLNGCLREGVQLTTAEENDRVLAPIRARGRFAEVWDSTIKSVEIERFGWEANPWVWVIEFEKAEGGRE